MGHSYSACEREGVRAEREEISGKLVSRVSLTFRTLYGSEVVNKLSSRQKTSVFARSAKIFGIEVHNVDLKQLAMLES